MGRCEQGHEGDADQGDGKPGGVHGERDDGRGDDDQDGDGHDDQGDGGHKVGDDEDNVDRDGGEHVSECVQQDGEHGDVGEDEVGRDGQVHGQWDDGGQRVGEVDDDVARGGGGQVHGGVGRGGGHDGVRGTIGLGVPGAWVPPLKGVSNFVRKHSDAETFNEGYYNGTKKMVVKAIIESFESFESIREGKDIMGAGLCGLQIKNDKIKKKIKSCTYSSPGKRRHTTLCNTEEELKEGGRGKTQSPGGSGRKRWPRGTATPPSRGTRRGAKPGTGPPKMVGVPPTDMCLAGATPPPCATPTSSGPPSPPPSGRGAPTPPVPSAKTENGTGIAGLRRLWEREQGPPQPAERETQWSSSSSSSTQRQIQPRKNKFCE